MSDIDAIVSAAFIIVTGKDPLGESAKGLALLQREKRELAFSTIRENVEKAEASARIMARKRLAIREWWITAKELSEKGWSQMHIGDALGVSQSAVSSALRAMRERGL